MGLDLDMFWVDLELLGRILVDLEFLVWILNFWGWILVVLEFLGGGSWWILNFWWVGLGGS